MNQDQRRCAGKNLGSHKVLAIENERLFEDICQFLSKRDINNEYLLNGKIQNVKYIFMLYGHLF